MPITILSNYQLCPLPLRKFRGYRKHVYIYILPIQGTEQIRICFVNQSRLVYLSLQFISFNMVFTFLTLTIHAEGVNRCLVRNRALTTTITQNQRSLWTDMEEVGLIGIKIINFGVCSR